MRKFTDETRRRLATGWSHHACTLREYARQNGVSERAIRLWRSQLRHEEGSDVPGGNAVVPLQASVDALQTRLKDLEAAVDAARAAVAAARAALDACYAVPAGTDATSEDGGENGQSIDAAQGSGEPEPAEVQDMAAEVDVQPALADALRPVPIPAPGFPWF